MAGEKPVPEKHVITSNECLITKRNFKDFNMNYNNADIIHRSSINSYF